jgi:ArsR family metal-binding transcriptional regulator
MERQITTFANRAELDKARAALERLGLPYDVLTPEPAYRAVGVPALVLSAEAVAALTRQAHDAFVASGWIDFRPPPAPVPDSEPPAFAEDLFGRCAIMLLAPCVADARKLRLIAHLGGDLAAVMPYLNAEMPHAMYNHEADTFTFMENYRMISLYPRRLTLAKADDIVDAWRVLESLRCLVNRTWARRQEITPSTTLRRKPPALEIYKRLPGTNCRQCGEMTCMAFAMRLWNGDLAPAQCKPVFQGAYPQLKEPLLAICTGLGLASGADTSAS